MNTRNLLFVENPNSNRIDDSERVLSFCESLTDQAYVYLLDPTNRRMHDTPGGVRILSRDLTELPNFGSLDGVIAVGDPYLLPLLRAAYPGVPLHMLMEQAGAEALILCEKYSANQLLGGLADKAAQIFGYASDFPRAQPREIALAS